MKSLCPRSAPVCPARLEDYRLTIALPAASQGNQPGWATVTPEAGAQVGGALFRLHADDLPALDHFEGLPGALRPERGGDRHGGRPPPGHDLHHAASHKSGAPGGALRRDAPAGIPRFRPADGGAGGRSGGDFFLTGLLRKPERENLFVCRSDIYVRHICDPDFFNPLKGPHVCSAPKKGALPTKTAPPRSRKTLVHRGFFNNPLRGSVFPTYRSVWLKVIRRFSQADGARPASPSRFVSSSSRFA